MTPAHEAILEHTKLAIENAREAHRNARIAVAWAARLAQGYDPLDDPEDPCI